VNPAVHSWTYPGFLALEMAAFVGILVVGFIYVWAKGDLNWIKAADIEAARRGGEE